MASQALPDLLFLGPTTQLLLPISGPPRMEATAVRSMGRARSRAVGGLAAGFAAWVAGGDETVTGVGMAGGCDVLGTTGNATGNATGIKRSVAFKIEVSQGNPMGLNKARV